MIENFSASKNISKIVFFNICWWNFSTSFLKIQNFELKKERNGAAQRMSPVGQYIRKKKSRALHEYLFTVICGTLDSTGIIR